MGIVGPDDREIYHQVNVDVSSLQAWSDQLHRLVGLTQAANHAVGHQSVNDFVGFGPDAASVLRKLNAEQLATLAAALHELDDRIARLRDAAAYVASSYGDADAYARAKTEQVEAGWSGQFPGAAGSASQASADAGAAAMEVANDG